ncbi:MAG: M16 family metallopeptidase, partial [Gemmatimonadota bacterium]
LAPAMALLADVVRRPAFPRGPVERMSDEQLADILQRKKEPRALASDAAAHFIFDDGVPYARPIRGADASVRELGPDHLRAFHDERYRAGSTALVVTGQMDLEAARDAAREHFGDWRGEPAPAPDFDVRPRSEGAVVHIVHRPGSVQSEIRLGHVGVERRHRDYFPLLVMNTILGGAFTSRLNISLRERHGFTYGARSAFEFRRRPGPFTVDVAVASDVTGRAIEEAMKEIGQLREDGPTREELDSARDYLHGVLPLRLQTTSALAARLAGLAVFDLPADYFQHYRDHIAEVTGEEVHRVAREAVRPEAMALVVVGDAEQIEEPIRALGMGEIHVHESLP